MLSTQRLTGRSGTCYISDTFVTRAYIFLFMRYNNRVYLIVFLLKNSLYFCLRISQILQSRIDKNAHKPPWAHTWLFLRRCGPKHWISRHIHFFRNFLGICSWLRRLLSAYTLSNNTNIMEQNFLFLLYVMLNFSDFTLCVGGDIYMQSYHF